VHQQLLDLGQALDDAYLRGHAYHSAAVVASHLGDLPLAVKNARQACRELEPAGADWARGVALLTLAQAKAKSGDLDAAQRMMEKGRRLVGDRRRWPGYDPQGEAAYYAGLIQLFKGDVVEAESFFDRALSLALRSGEQIFMALSLGFAGLALAFQGDFPPAMERLESGIRKGEEAGLPLASLTCAAGAAWVHGMMGHFGTALRLTAFASAEHALESRDAYALAHLARGDAHLELDDAEAALSDYQRALEVAGLSHVITIPALQGIGLAHLSLGKVEQGLTVLTNAVNMASFGGLRWFHARALCGFSRAHLGLGERAAAADHAAAVLDISQHSGYEAMIGWGYLLRGRAVGSEEDLKQALEMGRQLGILTLIWQAGEALGTDRARAQAVDAVQTIADDLPPGERRAFLASDSVAALLAQ
jgi:tetratricopeptide (TPR) repeat protein